MSLKGRLPGAVVPIAIVVMIVLMGFLAYNFLAGNAQPGSAVFSVTTFYDDGDSKTDSGNGSPWLGEKIVDDTTGKTIQRYMITMRITPVYSGNAPTTKATGTLTYKLNGVTKKTTPFSYTTRILTGATTVVVTEDLLASTLEGWDATTGTKSFTLQGDVTFEATYLSSVETRSATLSTNITYTVQPNDQITGLSITFSAPAVLV